MHLSLKSSPDTLRTLETPCLVLDASRMERNVAHLRRRLAPLGVSLRPHLKTAKSVEVARRVMASPAGPATVSTLKEATQFAAAGVRDVIYAVGIAPSKLERVLQLRAEGVDLAVVLDTVEQAEAVAAASRAAGVPIPALIEIDCDGHRSGVAPGDADRLLAIGRALVNGAQLRGVLTHAGGSYSARGAEALARCAEVERASVVEAARHAACRRPALPGGQRRLDTDGAFRHRARRRHRGARRRVRVLRPGDGRHRRLPDRRHRAVGARHGDRPPARQGLDPGRRRLDGDVAGPGHVEAGEEPGLRRRLRPRGPRLRRRHRRRRQPGARHRHRAPGLGRDAADLAIGDRVRILPNHACSTAAQHQGYHVVRGASAAIEAVWPRFGGW